MFVNRKGTELVIRFDSEEEAQGLFAVMCNTPQQVLPEVFHKGQWIYSWLYNSVHKLASDYPREHTVLTQSAETMQDPPQIPKGSRR